MKLFLLLALFCIFFILQETFFSKNWSKNLSLELKFQDHVLREGSRTCIIETIKNEKRLPLPILHVKLMLPRSFLFPFTTSASITDCYYRNDIFSVGGQEQLIRKLPFTAQERGYYHMSNITYSTKDYFLRNTFVRSASIFDYIYVTPNRIPSPQIPVEMSGLIGSVTREHAHLDDPFEFKGIRQYQPYDSYRAINWKATARQQDIQVNTFFSTFSCEIFFILNLEPRILAENTYLLEQSISILSTLASECIHKNISVGFTTNALDIETKRTITVMPGVGEHHENNIDLKLARIDLNQKCTLIKNCLHQIPSKQIMQIIFLSASCNQDAIDTFVKLQKMSDKTAWVVPYVYEKYHEGTIPSTVELIPWEVKEPDVRAKAIT